MKNKKLSMLVLIFGMVSIPCDQAKAEIDRNIVAGVIISSLGVASYAAYTTYQKYYKPLTYNDKKQELFKKLLHDKQGSDMNFDYVAHITQNMNLYTFEKFIEEAINCANKDNSQLVMMKHVFMAADMLFSQDENLVELEEEFQDDLMDYPDHIRAVALHEAGHAVATLCGANKLWYLYQINLFSDISRDGFICGVNKFMSLFDDEYDLTEEELRDFVKIDLGGYCAEIVFQQFSREDEGLDGNDADCAGESVGQILRIRSNGRYSFKEQHDEFNQLLIEIFQESCQLITLHKDKVEKLALALLKKKVLYADEIYELCGVDKPKLEIRK